MQRLTCLGNFASVCFACFKHVLVVGWVSVFCAKRPILLSGSGCSAYNDGFLLLGPAKLFSRKPAFHTRDYKDSDPKAGGPLAKRLFLELAQFAEGGRQA